LSVLGTFLEAHPTSLAGADIINSQRMFSGTLYPILDRLEASGWIEGEWEDNSAAKLGRPRRRHYSLTALGRSCAQQEIEKRVSRGGPLLGIPKGLQGNAV
jgi:PadR family transcriptional regulator, regulatory protein PadR